jgi:anti-anti-sigma factor
MLKTTIQTLGDATIFRCEGKIVFPAADTLRIAVSTHSPIRLAVLDLSGVNVIDAAGLGILASLRAWSRSIGTSLKLMNVNPRIEHLLELTHLRPLFETCSVRDMFELSCRLLQQSRGVETEASAEVPARVFGDSGPVSIEAQW